MFQNIEKLKTDYEKVASKIKIDFWWYIPTVKVCYPELKRTF